MVPVLELVRALRAALVAFDPEQCSGAACAVLVEEVATTEKARAAARLGAAARAGAAGAHRGRRFADVSDSRARGPRLGPSARSLASDACASVDRRRQRMRA